MSKKFPTKSKWIRHYWNNLEQIYDTFTNVSELIKENPELAKYERDIKGLVLSVSKYEFFTFIYYNCLFKQLSEYV